MKVNFKKCPQNHACPAVSICPVGAISRKGYSLPHIDESICVSCGACMSFCPMRAISE